MKRKIHFIILTLIIFFIYVKPATASFWYECEFVGYVDNIEIENTTHDNPDVTIDLTIHRSRLKRGHITDRTCGYERGDPMKITTISTAEELQKFEADETRQLEKKFFSPRLDIEMIQKNDRIKIGYSFFNSRAGDTHTWTLLKIKKLKRK